MSHEEQVSKIEKDVSAIKRWWPVITGAAAILAAAITLTFSATSYMDNKVAKKEDITALSEQVKQLSLQVSQLSNDFKETKFADGRQKLTDSIATANLKTELDNHISWANTEYRTILKKFNDITVYHEEYYVDKHGKRNVAVIPN